MQDTFKDMSLKLCCGANILPARNDTGNVNVCNSELLSAMQSSIRFLGLLRKKDNAIFLAG